MKNKGFTLAEVLITLGIIGVVAAMTLPSIIKNYQKQQTITAVQKAYTSLNQSLKLAIVDYESPEFWIEGGSGVNYETTLKYFNKYIKPYFKIAKICTGESTLNTDYYLACGYKTYLTKRSGGWQNNDLLKQNGNRVVFAATDGMIYFLYPYQTFCTEKDNSTPDNPQYDCHAEANGSLSMAVDINGPKEPNTWGKDTFLFDLNAKKGLLMPAGYSTSEEDIDKDCSKTNYQGGMRCSAKLVKDNWKMKSDYPW